MLAMKSNFSLERLSRCSQIGPSVARLLEGYPMGRVVGSQAYQGLVKPPLQWLLQSDLVVRF